MKELSLLGARPGRLFVYGSQPDPPLVMLWWPSIPTGDILNSSLIAGAIPGCSGEIWFPGRRDAELVFVPYSPFPLVMLFECDVIDSGEVERTASKGFD